MFISLGYVLDATMGKSLIEKLSVIRKIRRFSVPSTVTKSNVEDTEVYSYNEMVSGMIIKVISKADGLMIVIEVKNNRGNPSGILGISLYLSLSHSVSIALSLSLCVSFSLSLSPPLSLSVTISNFNIFLFTYYSLFYFYRNTERFASNSYS